MAIETLIKAYVPTVKHAFGCFDVMANWQQAKWDFVSPACSSCTMSISLINCEFLTEYSADWTQTKRLLVMLAEAYTYVRDLNKASNQNCLRRTGMILQTEWIVGERWYYCFKPSEFQPLNCFTQLQNPWDGGTRWISQATYAQLFGSDKRLVWTEYRSHSWNANGRQSDNHSNTWKRNSNRLPRHFFDMCSSKQQNLYKLSNLRVSTQWQNIQIWVNCPFKDKGQQWPDSKHTTRTLSISSTSVSWSSRSRSACSLPAPAAQCRALRSI